MFKTFSFVCTSIIIVFFFFLNELKKKSFFFVVVENKNQTINISEKRPIKQHTEESLLNCPAVIGVRCWTSLSIVFCFCL